MTKYETTTEETEILVLEGQIDELTRLKGWIDRIHHQPVSNSDRWSLAAGEIIQRIDRNIAELTTQLQALKQKARVS